jgi:3-hydroxymyristoyl/3-hydroxydecanoyl-(acyl carrier protein) dehydratase
MQLLHNFYTIASKRQSGTEWQYTLALNGEHFVYAAHFPGKPITPGVCIIQMVQELAEEVVQRRLALRVVKNVKFMQVIDPRVYPRIAVSIAVADELPTGYKVTATVSSGELLFAKLSLRFSSAAVAKTCVVIPTYNNEARLEQVITAVRAQALPVIVVNDGSTDGTAAILQGMEDKVRVVSYPKNRGKGFALRRGFDVAVQKGYEYALTIDADGQHYADDIPLFIELAAQHPKALLVGNRKLTQEGMPRGNTFANRFSNFWFTLQTGIALPDTQCGFRLYPLKAMKRLRPFTTRYEAELEMLVRCAWRGVRIVPVPVRVAYAQDRVTHFRPCTDFVRISLLNTVLTLLALPQRAICAMRYAAGDGHRTSHVSRLTS